MQIALLGTGQMAKGIAYALRDTTHDITLASREAVRAEALAKAMSEEHGRRYRGSSYGGACARADVVFLAVPWAAATDTILAVRDLLDDKIVVDLSNPLSPTFDEVVTPPDTSASELVAQFAGPRARVVAALKHSFAGTFAEPRIGGGPAPDVLVAGDDAQAKDTVSELVRAMGFGALDAGPLKVARTLERMTVLLIDLAQRNHWNWNAGWKVLR
jgi:NADPH-dependent F420 reductase